MAHHISALVARLPIEVDEAKRLELPVFVEREFAIVALNPNHADHWTGQLGLPFESFSGMIHDSPTTQEFARRLGMSRFALIETEYFGGVGEQFATVYDGSERVFEVTEGGINAALKVIGVAAAPGMDEFDTVGLGKYRSFWDHFEKYYQ